MRGQYASLKEILGTAKSVKHDVITCVGGGIITADPAVAMEAFKMADHGIIGEREIAVNALVYALENNEDAIQEACIVSRDGTMGPRNPGIPDLDILPFPDYDGFEFHLVLRGDLLRHRVSFSDNSVPIATGCSCPYNCSFCFSS